ncbi:MAG: hypothetical protein ACE5OT_05675 [Candidatus Hadarchaeaceae archaeon]
MEKIVYKRAAKSEFAKDKIRFEAAGLAAYGLLVGVIIAIFFEAYGDLAYFILVPFFVRTFVISVSARHITEKLSSRLNRVLQYVGPVIGVFVGLILIVNRPLLFLVFSMTMGFILYIVVRDMIPIGKEGKPIYFVAGVLITAATFLIS